MAATTVLSLPGGLKWNPKEILENARKHQFTRVRDGHKKVSYVSLSGAEQMWKKTDPAHNTTIYILRVPANILYPNNPNATGEMDIRLAGTPNDVSRALLAVVGGNQDIVNKILAYQINPSNYKTTFKDVVEAEEAAREAYKKTQAEHKVKHLSIEEILFYGSSKNVKQAIINHGTSAHPGFGPRRSQDIHAKLRSILPGGEDYNPNDLKSLDVSKMDLNTGHGAKKAKRPSASGTSKKIHYDALFPGIMSNDYEHFAAAVKLLYPEQAASPQGQQILAQIAQFYQGRVQQIQQQAASLSATGRISVPAAWGVPAAQPFPQQAAVQTQAFPQQAVVPGVPVTLPGATIANIPTLIPQ